jgi:hypothetical protein
MYRLGLQGPSRISFGIFCLIWCVIGGAEVQAQQHLPSWATPSPPEDRFQSEPSRRPPPDRSDPSRDGTSPTQRPSQGGGSLRTKASVCSPSACNPPCGNGETCISPGNGNAPCQCKSNDSGVVQNTVPIGGKWAPFWTVMMIVLAAGLGVYHLNRQGRTVLLS